MRSNNSATKALLSETSLKKNTPSVLKYKIVRDVWMFSLWWIEAVYLLFYTLPLVDSPPQLCAFTLYSEGLLRRELGTMSAFRCIEHISAWAASTAQITLYLKGPLENQP